MQIDSSIEVVGNNHFMLLITAGATYIVNRQTGEVAMMHPQTIMVHCPDGKVVNLEELVG
jgi:hypothetical protein